jgi:hypothetical protein
MYKGSAASAALLVVHLIFQISAASAQTSPGNVGLATGDVWPSRAKEIYVPRGALTPGIVDGQGSRRTSYSSSRE